MTNSISTIFTMDLYARFGRERSQHELVRSGRIVGVASMAIAALLARPLLGSFDQAFQAIQNYTGYFTPGIVAIFLMGLLWKRANEAGALAAAGGSFVMSIVIGWSLPELPFIHRVGIVFVLAMLLGVVVSLMTSHAHEKDFIRTDDVGFRTSASFNTGAIGVVAVLIALYAAFW